ncbi:MULTISPECIES: DKNYY domain-containing protein [unclassified Roseovarius]|uniref:DKNYY domain-containing protein n=1 Tax=unclassified Roseovarius TaxID=2614913 RepID=UPI00273FE2B3|nr:DKNYY domain-containing protein [Roseovarius sp. MMSF_3350]
MELDTTKFDILSQTYVRDADTIYLVTARKLKPIKSADADSFTALGPLHGRDATTGYFRDKRMRLAKGSGPADLRPPGHVYATDSTQFYFSTHKVPPPDGIDLCAPGLRLRWFDENEVNMPHVALTDGAGVWMSLTTGPDTWARLDGADFDTLAPLG